MVRDLGFSYLILLINGRWVARLSDPKKGKPLPPEIRKNRKKNKSVFNRIGICGRVLGSDDFSGWVGFMGNCPPLGGGHHWLLLVDRNIKINNMQSRI